MAEDKHTWTQDQSTASDVAIWGDKALGNDNYDEPFEVGGEPVDLDALPPFGDSDPPSGVKRSAPAPVRPG